MWATRTREVGLCEWTWGVNVGAGRHTNTSARAVEQARIDQGRRLVEHTRVDQGRQRVEQTRVDRGQQPVEQTRVDRGWQRVEQRRADQGGSRSSRPRMAAGRVHPRTAPGRADEGQPRTATGFADKSIKSQAVETPGGGRRSRHRRWSWLLTSEAEALFVRHGHAESARLLHPAMGPYGGRSGGGVECLRRAFLCERG